MGKVKWIVGGLGMLAGAAWAGLKLPPKPFSPTADAGRDLGVVELPDDLPEPVQRYFKAVTLLPRVESAYASGRGRFLWEGRFFNVWLPLRWHAYFEPGRQFRWSTDLTWFGQVILHGVDEIVGGEAKLIMNDQAMTGDAIDKAEHTILWLYTLAFCPSTLLTLPDVRWEPVDDMTARLVFPFHDDEWSFMLHFDPASSTLARITTRRFHEKTGAFRPYQATFAKRRSLGGTSLASAVSAAWGNDFYFHLSLEHVRYNVELPFPATGAM